VSPSSSTENPATTPPTGMAAEHPAMTTPHTRARSAAGTRSKIAVSMIGFNAPANSPLMNVTAISAASGDSRATMKNRGGPHSRNATKNAARLGSR